MSDTLMLFCFAQMLTRFKSRWRAGRKKHRGCIPADVIEALAEIFLPDIRSFFASEEGQREFAEWQQRKEEENRKKAAS